MITIHEKSEKMTARAVLDPSSIVGVSIQESHEVTRLDIFISGQILSFVTDQTDPLQREYIQAKYQEIEDMLNERNRLEEEMDKVMAWVR
jgi:hypothetical protein